MKDASSIPQDASRNRPHLREGQAASHSDRQSPDLRTADHTNQIRHPNIQRINRDRFHEGTSEHRQLREDQRCNIHAVDHRSQGGRQTSHSTGRLRAKLLQAQRTKSSASNARTCVKIRAVI